MRLPYRPLRRGREFWVVEQALRNADAVRARCLARTDWVLGAPHTDEHWPGMRLADALLPLELKALEDKVRRQTGATRLWLAPAPEGARIDCNVAQLVGADESSARPHTDSRRLCNLAAVLYLSPQAPADAGTSFYRLRNDDGTLDGNYCPEPHANLVEALGVTRLPVDAWSEEQAVDNVYNRLLVYRAEHVHSATRYFGGEREARRMTLVFFWMADWDGLHVQAGIGRGEPTGPMPDDRSPTPG